MFGAWPPFARLSCGYVWRNVGWTDLAEGFKMDWEFDRATDGNVALTGEIKVSETREFTLALSLSDCPYGALTEGRCNVSTVGGRAVSHALMSRHASPRLSNRHFPPA
jgi:hypothetical protein